jgi:hypothetical protein
VTGVRAAGGQRQDELEWLREVLWGPTPAVEVVVGRDVPAGFQPLAEWAILPDRRRPRVLVPLASKRAAAAAVRQYSDGMTQRARLTKALVGLGLRSGGPQRLLTRRGSVLRAGAGGAPAAAAEGTLLHDYLPEALGRRDLAAAIVLGPVRLNRKPVLQLVDVRGEPVGYMKVGWNDLTRRLVRNEAAMLARLAELRPRTFAAPRLLHHGRWHGLEVTVSAALPHRLWRRGRRYRLPPLAATREIAALGGVQRATLGDSAWWRGLHRRLDPIRQRTTDRAATVLAAVLESLQQAADARLAFGTWHGDWGPWNMRATPERLLVWDWERSGDGVPVGLDLLHFGYLTGVQGLRRPPASAAAASLRGAAPLLGDLGQEPDAGALLLDLYLLELFCRASEAEASVITGRPDALGTDLLDVLDRRRGPSAAVR